MTLLVCGGRNYADQDRVERFLDRIHNYRPIELMVTGACYYGGADLLAENWARRREVPYVGIPAKFKSGVKGRGEGPARNDLMIEAMRPHLVIAFPGGRGTADMVAKARAANVWTIDTAEWQKINIEKLRAIGK